MIYYSSKEPFDFRMFKTIRSFGDNIYSSKNYNKWSRSRAIYFSRVYLKF